MPYSIEHNHPGSAVYSTSLMDCPGCASRAKAVNAVSAALMAEMGYLPLSTRQRAAWEAVVKAEGYLRMAARPDAEIAAELTKRARGINDTLKGVLSDQGRNQTPLTPSESTGIVRRSLECSLEDCGSCDLRNPVVCDCKCHVIRAAYSG